jgi:hypothetical protein
MKKGVPFILLDTANFYTEGSAVMPDSLRFYSSNYFTENRGKLEKTSAEPFFNVEEKKDYLELSANKQKFLINYFDESSGVLESRFDPNLWNEFVTENVPVSTSVFYDFYSEHAKLLNIADNPESILKNLAYINKEFKYNFLSRQYESLVGNPVFDVATLPSIYDFIGDQNTSELSRDETISLTFGGFVDSGVTRAFQNAKSVDESVKQYFDAYTKARLNPDARPTEMLISGQKQEFTITREKSTRVSGIAGDFVPFPFYGYCEFSNLSSDSSEAIHEMAKLGILDENFLEFSSGRQPNLTNYVVQEDSTVAQKQLNSYDFKLWLNKILQPSATVNNINLPVRASKFVDYIVTYLKSAHRSYSQLLSKQAKTSVLYYKIEKRQGSFNSPVVQQTFYILPTTEEIIKFFDTQIKYGVEYFYTMTAVTLVVGNRYRYLPYKYTEAQRASDIRSGVYRVGLENNTEYRVFDIPVASWSGAAVEAPFTKPKFLVSNTENKLQFTFMQSDLESLEEFNVVESTDFQLFDKIRRSQDNIDGTSIYSTINKNSTSKLQIFRITGYPLSHLDFQGSLYKTVELNTKTLVDEVIPDKKYYYLFRYLNDHNIPSNTSQVIEVQLKDYDGFMQLETKVVPLEGIQEISTTKDMRRYVLIRASSIQTYPQNTQDSLNSTNDAILGAKQGSVWGKDFVVKLTSKKTGRVIKINFTVNLQK